MDHSKLKYYAPLTQGYRSAVQGIATNDDQELGSADTGWLVTICMVADLFDKEQDQVGADVERFREQIGFYD